jgi:CRP/FNR family nitrogen fixation transcriptional regulator
MARQGARLTVSDGLYSLGGAGKPEINVIPIYDLWVRLGKAQYLDVPMAHQDIADYLGLTIETLSRSITDLERSGLISRVASQRRLLLQNHFGLRRVVN